MMTMDQQLARNAQAGAAEQPAFPSLWSGFTAWIEAWAAAYAASAVYQDLSRLSDAELRRRGLNRETLAREVVEACERRD